MNIFTLDSLKCNLTILKTLSEAISCCNSNLSKILYDNKSKSVIISSDPYIILKYINIEHPIAEFIKKLLLSADYLSDSNQLSKTLLLSTILVENALSLFISGLAPSMIIEGYRVGLRHTIEYLTDHHKDRIIIKLPELNQPINSTFIQSITNNNNTLISESIEKSLSLLANSVINNSKSGGSNNDSWSKRLQSIYIMKSIEDNYNNNIDNENNIKIVDGLVIPIYRCSNCKELINNSVSGSDDSKNNSGGFKVIFYHGDLKRSQSGELQMELKLQIVEDLISWQRDEELIYKHWVNQLVDLNISTVFISGDVESIALHYLNLSNILVFKNINQSIFQRLLNSTITHSNNNNNNNITILYNTETKINNEHIGLFHSISEYSKLVVDDNSLIIYYHLRQAQCSINTVSIMVDESNYRYQDLKKQYEDTLFCLRSLDQDEEFRKTMLLINNNNANTNNNNSLENNIYKYILDKLDNNSTIRFSIEKFANSFISLYNQINSNNNNISIMLHSYLKICKDATDIATILIGGNLLQ